MNKNTQTFPCNQLFVHIAIQNSSTLNPFFHHCLYHPCTSGWSWGKCTSMVWVGNSTGQRAWWCFNISTEASHEWYGIPLIDMHFPAKARVKRSLLDKWSSDQLTLVILLMVFRNPKAKPPTCMKNLVNDGIYYHINWLSGFFHINSMPYFIYLPWKLTYSTWYWMVGRGSFPFGARRNLASAFAVSFREGRGWNTASYLGM